MMRRIIALRFGGLTLLRAGDIKRLMETESLAQELSDQDRVLLVFGYMGPLALVSLMASRREFVKWHAKQGGVLSVAVASTYAIMHIFDLAIGGVPFLGDLFWALGWVTMIGVVLAMLTCIVRALEGERLKVPVLGDLAEGR
jgi:uncharacterized membrane protein